MPVVRNLVLLGHFKMGEGNTKDKTLPDSYLPRSASAHCPQCGGLSVNQTRWTKKLVTNHNQHKEAKQSKGAVGHLRIN